MRRHTAPWPALQKHRLFTVFHAVLLAGIEALMRAINLNFCHISRDFATSAGEKAGLYFTQKGFSFCWWSFGLKQRCKFTWLISFFLHGFLVGLSVETLEKIWLVFLFPPCFFGFLFFGCPMGAFLPVNGGLQPPKRMMSKSHLQGTLESVVPRSHRAVDSSLYLTGGQALAFPPTKAVWEDPRWDLTTICWWKKSRNHQTL